MGKKLKEKESTQTSETHPCIGVQREANVQGSESNKTNKQRRLKCRVAIQVQLVHNNSLMIYRRLYNFFQCALTFFFEKIYCVKHVLLLRGLSMKNATNLSSFFVGVCLFCFAFECLII